MPFCTIVMYHYVRPLASSRYPEIKGLTLDEFRVQLDFLLSQYHPVTVDELLAALNEKRGLPDRALMLTFDDGFIDHYIHVFPILDAKGVQGVFFPPTKAIEDKAALDVHKIHHILSRVQNHETLVKEIFQTLDELRQVFHLESNETYFQKLAVANRFDPKEIIFVKRLLQVELPLEARRQVVQKLFERYLDVDEKVFASELYMTCDQLETMVRHGHVIGGHGYEHVWLNALEPADLEREIGKTGDFLARIGMDAKKKNRVFSYPYGGHSDLVIQKLKDAGYQAAFGTRFAPARVERDNAFDLERLDTNDFPPKRSPTHAA